MVGSLSDRSRVVHNVSFTLPKFLWNVWRIIWFHCIQIKKKRPESSYFFLYVLFRAVVLQFFQFFPFKLFFCLGFFYEPCQDETGHPTTCAMFWCLNFSIERQVVIPRMKTKWRHGAKCWRISTCSQFGARSNSILHCRFLLQNHCVAQNYPMLFRNTKFFFWQQYNRIFLHYQGILRNDAAPSKINHGIWRVPCKRIFKISDKFRNPPRNRGFLCWRKFIKCLSNGARATKAPFKFFSLFLRPRKETRRIYPFHISNVRCHCPKSPNTAPSTKKNFWLTASSIKKCKQCVCDKKWLWHSVVAYETLFRCGTNIRCFCVQQHRTMGFWDFRCKQKNLFWKCAEQNASTPNIHEYLCTSHGKLMFHCEKQNHHVSIPCFWHIRFFVENFLFIVKRPKILSSRQNEDCIFFFQNEDCIFQILESAWNISNEHMDNCYTTKREMFLNHKNFNILKQHTKKICHNFGISSSNQVKTFVKIVPS